MKRLLLAGLLLFAVSGNAVAGDWAEVDVSGYINANTLEVTPLISTVYFFKNKGIGLQFGGTSTENDEVNMLTSWRVWSIYWGEKKDQALFVHVFGRVVNEIGEDFDFRNGDVGFEVRPDFSVTNKITSSIRVLWRMEDKRPSNVTVGAGVQFDIT